MKHALAVAILLLAGLASCAATLNVSATAPTKDNNGTCAAPALVANVSTKVWMHFVWTGPSSGNDSLLTALGVKAAISRQVPAGIYTIRSWASDSGGVGCDTTITTTLKGPPGKIGDLRPQP